MSAPIITNAQVTEQLESLGYSVPSFIIDAYLCKLDSIRECLEAAGHDECDLMLIQIYAVTLMTLTAYQQRIKSQTSAFGASRSFEYTRGVTALWDTLQRLDKTGCTADLPIDIEEKVGFFMVADGR